jgi:elongation factor Ts
VKLSGRVATYLHRKSADLLPQIGVLVQYAGEDLAAARCGDADLRDAAAVPPATTSRPTSSRTNSASRRQRRGGQAGTGPPQDHRGSPERLLQGQRAARAASVHDNKKTVKAVLDDAGVFVTGFCTLRSRRLSPDTAGSAQPRNGEVRRS